MVYLTIQNCEQFVNEKVVCLNIINRSDFFDTTCHLGDIVIGYEHSAKREAQVSERCERARGL